MNRLVLLRLRRLRAFSKIHQLLVYLEATFIELKKAKGIKSPDRVILALKRLANYTTLSIETGSPMLTIRLCSSATLRLLTVSLLMLGSSIALAQSDDTKGDPLSIDDESVVFLYESRASEKASDDVFAYAMSEEFRQAREEFTRYDILQDLRPRIKEKLNEANEAQTVSLTISGGQLAEYDFEKQAFPLTVGDLPRIAFKEGYDVRITNADELSLLPVPLQTARELAADLQESRQIEYVVIGDIGDVKREGLTSSARKIVEIEATRLEVKFLSGKEVGTLDL